MTHASPAAAAPLDLRPLLFETFACTMAMVAFIALAGPIARVLGLAPWQIGIAVTVAGIAWMMMSRIWGIASDRRGRRSVMLAGLCGFALVFALLSIFIDLALRGSWPVWLSLAGIIIGRGLAGIFYAAVPTTTAALIADHVAPDQRANAMATLGAAGAAGMVLGPGAAGLLAPLGLAFPLYFLAALPILALIILWRALPRSEPTAPSARPPLSLNDPRLRRAMAVAFVAMFSVANAQITVGFYALDRIGLAPAQAAHAAGIALAIVGVSLVISQLALRKLGWPPARFIRIGATIGACGFACSMLATTAPMLWASYGFAAAGMGWVYPSFPALAANAVESHEQGAAQGTVAAAQGLGVILGPIAGTFVYGIDPRAPYLLIAILLLTMAHWPARSR